VLVLTSKALAWLLGASVLGVIASIKLHAPGFLASCPWLTYGRVQPAAWNLLVYGFLVQAGLAVALWVTCRLCASPLRGGKVIALGAVLWNYGVLFGLIGILAGDSTGVETLEMPVYAALVLLTSYLGIAAWVVVTFHHRRERSVFISLWFILGAVFAFPWLYATGYLAAVVFPLRGVLQAAAQAWYAQNLFTLFFTFIGLAIAFYFIPKLTGVAVPSRALATFGFWTLALFGGLGGMQRYLGGPFPAYMVSLGVAAAGLGLLPLIAVGLNLWPVLRGQGARVRATPVLWFVGFGLASFLVASLLGLANCFDAIGRTTRLTLYTLAAEQLTLQGFFAMSISGALYYLVPRVLGCEWPSTRLVVAHFAAAAAGILLTLAAFGAGGFVHGAAMNDATLPFLNVVRACLPFEGTATLGSLLLLVGYFAFALNLALLLAVRFRSICVPRVSGWLRPELAASGAKA
jgi:cytochrome c oxidase cbb3-type subunit 1